MDLNSINKRIEGEIRRSPKVRLITLFRAVKNDPRILLIGEIPLIARILSLLNTLTDRKVSRWEILKVINETTEFRNESKKEKSESIEALMRNYLQRK